MDERALRALLREVEVPDAAGARARARRTVHAAHAARPRPRRRSAWRRVPVAGLAAVVAATGLCAVSLAAGPGRVVGWASAPLRQADRVPSATEPASALALPGGGRVLIRAGDDAWIVGEGRARRAASGVDSVAWSAFGNYVARAVGRTLDVVAREDGRLAWRLAFPDRVDVPAWSPDGERIAIRVGEHLWLTAGDGTGRRPVGAGQGGGPLSVAAVRPAWRPAAGRRQLAVVRPGNRLAVVDLDVDRVVWSTAAPAGTFTLAWSRDGARLLAAGPAGWTLLAPGGAVVAHGGPDLDARLVAAALAPSGHQLAVISERTDAAGGARRTAELLRPGAAPRVLVVGDDLAQLAYAPDGRWLLVTWPRVDGWLFFATADGDRRVRLVDGISAIVRGRAPLVEGWCCAEQAP